jgi:hypothetical protein
MLRVSSQVDRFVVTRKALANLRLQATAAGAIMSRRA